MSRAGGLHGMLGEFTDPERLVRAAEVARRAGWRRLDAYTPFPVEGLAEALGLRRDRVAAIVLVGGVLGAAGGLGMQWYAQVVDYPMNVGGRPDASWPSWVPVTFECAVLAAALGAVLGMLALNGLPRPHHPVFGAPRFALASRDRFFLCLEAADPRWDADAARRLLEEAGAEHVDEVRE